MDQPFHHRQRNGSHQSGQQRHAGPDPADYDLHGHQPWQRFGQFGLVYAQSYQNVVTNVAWDGTNLKQTVTQEYVFGAGTSTTSTIDTPTVCATG